MIFWELKICFNFVSLNFKHFTMRKHLLVLAAGVFLISSAVIAQTGKNLTKKDFTSKIKKERSMSDMSPSAHKHTSSSNATKAQWDILYSFNTSASGEQAVATDGNFIYTTNWGGTGVFHKYAMDGTYISDFTITGASAIRDLAYDGTYFYGGAAGLSLYKMDFTAGTLVSTITVSCSGVTGVRHCTYDPTLDGGNGGFWVGNWTELGAISMTGTQLVASVTGNADCYGSAYDKWSDPANPRLLLFQQGGSGVEIHAFDINTQTFTGLVHDAADIPNFVSGSIAGGMETYEANGYLVLIGNIQQDPNLVFAYELATTANAAAPAAASLTVTPDANGALTYDISWTNPTLAVDGSALTEITSISYYVDNVLVTGLTYNLTVGGANSFTAQTVATPGYHTFKVVCANTAGDGLPVSVTEWIGYIPPANITFSNIEDVSANVAWTQAGSPNSWDIEILTSGGTPTGTPTYNTTTNPYGFTGLTASTAYDVYMRADYTGGNSVWVGPFTFTTEHCPTANQCGYVLQYVDDYGDGWNGASITVNQDGISVGDFTLANGTDGADTIMLCSNANITLVFNSGSYDSECGFTLVDPFGATLTTFAIGSAPSGGSTFYTFTSNCTPPTCITPTNVHVVSANTTTAQIAWTNGGSETAWNIEYGPAGFTQGSGTTVAATTNPYTLTGLTEGTTYDVYVQADCGSGDVSYWTSQAVSFTTTCNPYTTFPFSESFEGATFQPQCWSNVDADGDGYKWITKTASGDGWRIYDGDVAAVSASWVDATVGAVTPNNYLITPNFTIPNANMVLKFHIAPQDPLYPGEYFGLEVSTTGNAPADFTSIYTYTLLEADSVYKEVILPLAAYSGQNIYIAFRHYNVTDMYYMLLDKVEIYESNNINVNDIKSNIFVYPNPATTTLTVANENALSIEIFNLNGQKVAEYNNTNTANVADLAQGTYMVKVVTNNNVITQKINIVR